MKANVNDLVNRELRAKLTDLLISRRRAYDLEQQAITIKSEVVPELENLLILSGIKTAILSGVGQVMLKEPKSKTRSVTSIPAVKSALIALGASSDIITAAWEPKSALIALGVPEEVVDSAWGRGTEEKPTSISMAFTLPKGEK